MDTLYIVISCTMFG